MHIPFTHLSKSATQNILDRSSELKAKLQELRDKRHTQQQKPVPSSQPRNS